jgi:amino acid adenylation domain-containing protein
VFEHVVVPATALLELAHAAGRAARGGEVAVADLSIEQALTLSASRATALQTVVQPQGRVEIFARHEDGWRRHATATIERATKRDTRDDLAAARTRCPTPQDTSALYAAYTTQGLAYGPAFRGVTTLWRGENESVAEIVRPADVAADAYALHPVLLDACFQAAGAAFGETKEVFLPMRVARWEVNGAIDARVWCHARAERSTEGAIVNLTLFAADGRVVAWLKDLALQRATADALHRSVQRSADALYALAWPVARGAVASAALTGEWLVIGERDGVGERLRAAGANVTAVEPTEVAATFARRNTWHGVVHLAAPERESLLALSRGLAKADAVWVVTRGAVALDGETISPAAAALWGLGRVLMQEHPEWSLRLVEVDAAGAADAIVRECLGADAENQTAWRAGVRHAARLQLLDAPLAPPIALRADATYLVSGGLGALGLLAAGWLVTRGAKHLVLVGRRAPNAETQTQIAAWTAAGVRVEVRAVDIADRSAVAALLATLPALRGIVHAAGTTADGAARSLTTEQFARVFAPKADGARHLDELAGDLDFFVLFSSAASVLGTPGQANYAAANAYLDGLALARRARGKPALSVNWGGWTVGLAAGLGERYAARGISAIAPARGFADLERLLAANVAQALVLPVDWRMFFAALPAGRVPPLLSDLAPTSAPDGEDAIAAFRAKFAAAATAERPALLSELVRTEVARVLRLAPEKLGDAQAFNALGLDSIMAVDVRNRLRLATDADVPLVALLEAGTVAAVTTAILGRVASVTDAPSASAGAGSASAFELSAGQEALWFLHQAAPESAAYNTAVALRLRGSLERAKLRQILARVAARHPLLRASFALEGSRPTLRIAPSAVPELREVDAAGWSAERLEREVAADYQRPFQLERGVMFRATLFTVTADDQVLLLGAHHIVGDAWTNWVLLDELRQLLAGATMLPPVAGTYADFVRWQQTLLAGAEGERLWAFWQRELAGEVTALALPTDFPRPPVLTPHGASAPLAVSAATWEKIRVVARAQGATPFSVLLAAFYIFLHRHTGQEEIIVGSPTSGRSRPEFAGVVGYFVNPVPMRACVAGRMAFADFLATVKRTVLGALAHADFPLPLLVERLKLPRDPSRPALFQTLFVFQKPPQTDSRGDALTSAGATRAAWGGLDVAEFPLAQMEGQFELTLELFEDRGGSLKYNTALFAPETVTRMAQRFTTLLDAIVADPARPIDDLPLMAAEERQRVVHGWNDTPADYPQQICLHELIAQQVARTPDAPALTFEGETLTYRQFDERANRLAHWLRRNGVRADTLVGVCAERSLELVVALLGIIKAGGAYVPLDPGYPRERLAFMTEDSAVALVLTQAKFAEELRASGVRPLRLDADWAEIAREPAHAPASETTPDHLAYMIYTSGSTGRPKGATNTHRAIVNRLLWMQDAYRLTAADTVVQKTPFSFDVSVWEFFWPLLTGARLVVAKPGGHQDAAYLADLVARERVTTMHFVPSMLQVFVEQPGLARCMALRQVFCSGEALPFELQERFFARHAAELHNLYGPTEAAVDVTFWKCERGATRRIVPIGRPIARTQIHVLDARLQPVPVGVAGELHIGGIGLARGYHRRAELTAEKFIPDPFGAPGSRLYKTGDLARWLPDGAIEYLGRLDHQVKLRGFRIELGEIETALTRQPGVREATVIVHEDRSGEKALTAYLVAANGAAPSAAELRRALRASLPDYMVPADFVVLPALPLSPNGKVDRRALPAPVQDRVDAGVRFVAPESATEQLLATVWREALGRERVGVEDNFFDLGGHSLKLGQVHARLQTRFARVPALLELFQYPTIRGLAARLDQGENDEAAVATARASATVAPEAPSRGALSDQRALRRAARAGKAAR